MKAPKEVTSRVRALPLIPLLVLLAEASSARGWQSTPAPAFDGNRAFADLKRLVAFGPRPSGSQALEQARAWMRGELERSGCRVEEDPFRAETPIGELPMDNLIVKIPGERRAVVMVAGHYDTKRFDGFRFVGANDGASSAAELLELGRILCRRQNPLTIWLVFFDGEEAVREWSPADSLYGSRHLVRKLSEDGELARIKAMILVDMIGDAQLDIRRDQNSTPWLANLVFGEARRQGYARQFRDEPTAIDDDHIPFVNAGVSAVDLIDLDYGPANRYWHSAEDTVAHCSPRSLAMVGRVVLASLDRLAADLRLQ
jgi:glutaminyl-peptide cyclotransferase